MNEIDLVFAALWALAMSISGFTIVSSHRNFHVFQFRAYLNNAVLTQTDRLLSERLPLIKSEADLSALETEITAYWAVLNSVSYNRMVRRFWQPLPSFFAGTILEPLIAEMEKK